MTWLPCYACFYVHLVSVTATILKMLKRAFSGKVRNIVCPTGETEST